VSRVLLVALLLIAGCAHGDPEVLFPSTPAGYQEVSDVGFWLVAPGGWQVLEEDERQVRFAAEVVGPQGADGFEPRVGLILDEGTRWEDVSALTEAFHGGALVDARATVTAEESIGGMGSDARLLESTYRDDAARVRQYDLLMVVDGLGIDLRVAAAAADFDEEQARTIVTSLRLPQTLEAAAVRN
jgi:hypothetical protein